MTNSKAASAATALPGEDRRHRRDLLLAGLQAQLRDLDHVRSELETERDLIVSELDPLDRLSWTRREQLSHDVIPLLEQLLHGPGLGPAHKNQIRGILEELG